MTNRFETFSPMELNIIQAALVRYRSYAFEDCRLTLVRNMLDETVAAANAMEREWEEKIR